MIRYLDFECGEYFMSVGMLSKELLASDKERIEWFQNRMSSITKEVFTSLNQNMFESSKEHQDACVLEIAARFLQGIDIVERFEDKSVFIDNDETLSLSFSEYAQSRYKFLNVRMLDGKAVLQLSDSATHSGYSLPLEGDSSVELCTVQES
jgi:hypothetical protein